MSAKMWMCTRTAGAWVKMPDAGLAFTPVGWSQSTAGASNGFMNGGAAVRRSKTTHMEYPMMWQNAKRLDVSALRDFYTGVYGPGLIYFIDPMAADLNVLPAQWAFPALACYDGIPIIGPTGNSATGSVTRPTNVSTPTNAFGYPTESAQYALTGTLTSRTLYIPIPAGFDAWVGVQGSISGTGGLRVTPVVRSTGANGTAVFPAMLPVTGSTRVNTQIPGATNSGIILDIAGGTATTVTLSGMCVQILPTGTTPSTGNFIGGLGNSGCDYNAAPSTVALSAPLDQVSANWTLIEAGDWR